MDSDCVGSSDSAWLTPEFLDDINRPIFLIDGRMTILAGNEAARGYVGGGMEHLRNRLCGGVIRCVNAVRPGGCGKTDQCPACTIRKSVLHTITTGAPVSNVTSLHTLSTTDGDRAVTFRISTEETHPFVFLAIDRRADSRT